MYELATQLYPVALLWPSLVYLLCGGGLFGAVLIFLATKLMGK